MHWWEGWWECIKGVNTTNGGEWNWAKLRETCNHSTKGKEEQHRDKTRAAWARWQKTSLCHTFDSPQSVCVIIDCMTRVRFRRVCSTRLDSSSQVGWALTRGSSTWWRRWRLDEMCVYVNSLVYVRVLCCSRECVWVWVECKESCKGERFRNKRVSENWSGQSPTHIQANVVLMYPLYSIFPFASSSCCIWCHLSVFLL